VLNALVPYAQTNVIEHITYCIMKSVDELQP